MIVAVADGDKGNLWLARMNIHDNEIVTVFVFSDMDPLPGVAWPRPSMVLAVQQLVVFSPADNYHSSSQFVQILDQHLATVDNCALTFHTDDDWVTCV